MFGDQKLPARPRRDSHCLTPASEVVHKRWALIADTRSAGDHSRAQIPNAVNIAIANLLTNKALASQPILIYEQGRVAADAEVLCARLRDGGFTQARVLSGGFVAWARLQDGQDILREAEVAVADLMGAIASGAPLVVVLNDGYPVSEFGPNVLRIDDPSARRISSAIKTSLRKPATKGTDRVILIGNRRIADSVWREVVANREIAQPVLFHRADPDEFAGSFKALAALWAKKEQGPVKLKGCSAS